ncbi:kinase-like protein [Hypoxylon sp. FL0543]|nr:kinase-like protein [Hypoxylon sp. FL0543]
MIHNNEFEKSSLKESEQSGNGILKISDFGLTHWHRDVSSNKTDGEGVFVSKTYRAPEYDLKNSPTQSWDIWALACLYLEFLTWYLHGWESGVDEFSDQRGTESASLSHGDNCPIKEDHFFNLTRGSESTYEASLKCQVIIWVNKLHATEGCSQFIHDFLDLISDHMLRIRPANRHESKLIAERLDSLYDKCKGDKLYCHESAHGQRKKKRNEYSPPMRNLDSYDSLDDLLRNTLNKHPDGPYKSFQTLRFLQRELSVARVRTHLHTFFDDAVAAGYTPRYSEETYLNLVCLDGHSKNNSGEVTAEPKTYIRLFATLVLVDRGPDVFKFIDNGISDEKFPIDMTDTNFQPCIRGWRQRNLDDLDGWQWRMNVPFLAYGQHRIFDAQVVLPFVNGSETAVNNPDSDLLGTKSRITPITEAGGYGEVSYVEIHSDCHDFRGVFGPLPRPEGPFARKKLFVTNPATVEDDFKKEIGMLKKFNGDVHPHIVTVLMSYKHNGHYYLLFPWAECDLGRYFERNPNPPRSLQTVQWVSEQCLRIMEAVHLIHFPPGLDRLQPPDRLFGRHGDIKAENILVFKSQSGKMNLVLSDFGLGSVHHDMSKSNIPNEAVSRTPCFRPPECDMKGGRISRAFDVWTLGCLFLDLLIWLLGGEELRLKFEEERFTPYINGYNTLIYFDIVTTEDGQPAYIVKQEVKRWFAQLHRHDHCTQFMHEFLDLIEQKMLIVETNVRKRARTEELLQNLWTFYRRCHGRDAQRYCVDAAPDRNPLIVRAPTIAEGPLNETAEANIKRFRVTLRKVAGRTQQAEQAED